MILTAAPAAMSVKQLKYVMVQVLVRTLAVQMTTIVLVQPAAPIPMEDQLYAAENLITSVVLMVAIVPMIHVAAVLQARKIADQGVRMF
jgi:hypothetical protein